MGSRQIPFVLLRAGWTLVIFAPDTPVVVGTNINSGAGNTEDRFCNQIGLKRVSVLLVSKWENQP